MSAAGRSDPKTDKPRKLIFIDLETIASANRLEGESEFKNLEGGLRTMGRVVGRALSQPELDELINSRRSQPDDFVLVRRNGDDGNSVCPDGAKVVRQLWKLHQLGYTLVSGSSQNDENEQAAILEALQIQASQYNREHQLTETDDDYLQVPPFEKARGNVTTADKQELRKQVTSHFNVTPSTEHIVIDKSIYVLLKARGEGYSAYPAITANDRIPNARPLTDILYTIIAQNQTSELKTEVKSEAKKEAAPVLTAEEKEANAFVETELDQRKNLLTPESSPSDHLPRKVGSDMIIYNIMTQYGTENDEATSGYVVADDKTGAPTAETPDQYRNRLLNRIAPLLVQMAQKNSSVDFLVLQEAPRVSDEKSLGQEFLNGVLDKLGREWDVESQKDVPLSKCTFYRKTKYTVDKSASFSLQRQISFKCNLLLLPQEQPTAREIEQAQTMHRPLLYKKGADFFIYGCKDSQWDTRKIENLTASQQQYLVQLFNESFPQESKTQRANSKEIKRHDFNTMLDEIVFKAHTELNSHSQKEVFPVVFNSASNKKIAICNAHLEAGSREKKRTHYTTQISGFHAAAQAQGCTETRVAGDLNHPIGINGPRDALAPNLSSATTFSVAHKKLGAAGNKTYSVGMDGGVSVSAEGMKRESDILIDPRTGEELASSTPESKAADLPLLQQARANHRSYREQGLADLYLDQNFSAQLDSIQAALSDQSLCTFFLRTQTITKEDRDTAAKFHTPILEKINGQYTLYGHKDHNWNSRALTPLTSEEKSVLDQLFRTGIDPDNKGYEKNETLLKILNKGHDFQFVSLDVNQFNAHRLDIFSPAPIPGYEQLIEKKTHPSLTSELRPNGFHYYLALEGASPELLSSIFFKHPIKPVSIGYAGERRIFEGYLLQSDTLSESLKGKKAAQEKIMQDLEAEIQTLQKELLPRFMEARLREMKIPDEKIALVNDYLTLANKRNTDLTAIKNLVGIEHALSFYKALEDARETDCSNDKVCREKLVALAEARFNHKDCTENLPLVEVIQESLKSKIQDLDDKLKIEFDNIQTACIEYQKHLNSFFTRKNTWGFFKHDTLGEKQQLAGLMVTELSTLSNNNKLNYAEKIEHFYAAFKGVNVPKLAISRDKKTAICGKAILSALIIALGATLVFAPFSYYGVKRIWRKEGAEKTKQIDASLQKALGTTLSKKP